MKSSVKSFVAGLWKGKTAEAEPRASGRNQSKGGCSGTGSDWTEQGEREEHFEGGSRHHLVAKPTVVS